MDTNAPTKNTSAHYAQSAISFGIALVALLAAITYLPGDRWPKAFLALAPLYLTTSAFTLAKVIRDGHESQYVASRLDQSRVDKILAERDPWNGAA